MSKIVLDASALLALFNQEPGHEIVEKHLPQAIMSTINLSEVISVLLNIEIPFQEAESMAQESIGEIIPFDQEQAVIAARLRKTTKAQGLSLGDRACLALAEQRHLPVLTADKVWSKINSPFKILLVR